MTMKTLRNLLGLSIGLAVPATAPVDPNLRMAGTIVALGVALGAGVWAFGLERSSAHAPAE